jgi:hypothetical protein
MPNRGALACGAAAAILILVAACNRDGRSDAEDGGPNLDRRRMDKEVEDLRSRQPCWRRERGGWHYSIVHCETMGPPGRMSGVFVTAFEERSFFPGATAIPAPDDKLRYASELELVPSILYRFAGAEPRGRYGDAYAVSFVGRRTRDPYFVDCGGNADFLYVVDRLVTARFLGPVPPPPGTIEQWTERMRDQPVTVTVCHGGNWGRLEAEALKRCREMTGRGKG